MVRRYLVVPAVFLFLVPATLEASHRPRLCAAPGGAYGCFATIQAAIDQAPMGATISVYPGQYTETAANRFVLGIGPYQFGLFISMFKSGITLRGVDSRGDPIDDYRRVKAFVTTVATNNFGPSGIFVEGDNVTIQGLGIGVNLAGQNKTIEVIGDDFTLKDSDIADTQGSVYINDFRFDESSNTSHVRGYTIAGNNFRDGMSIDLANGAGFSGDVDRRRIAGNRFANSFEWPSISFNGSGTGIPFFIFSVGGAVIERNEFVNTFSADRLSRKSGHIRARGTYDNREFDWARYWHRNKFNHAFVAGPKPPFQLRTFSYSANGVTFRHVRRIGVSLQGELDIARPGDRVRARHHHDDDDDHDHHGHHDHDDDDDHDRDCDDHR